MVYTRTTLQPKRSKFGEYQQESDSSTIRSPFHSEDDSDVTAPMSPLSDVETETSQKDSKAAPGTEEKPIELTTDDEGDVTPTGNITRTKTHSISASATFADESRSMAQTSKPVKETVTALPKILSSSSERKRRFSQSTLLQPPSSKRKDMHFREFRKATIDNVKDIHQKTSLKPSPSKGMDAHGREVGKATTENMEDIDPKTSPKPPPSKGTDLQVLEIRKAESDNIVVSFNIESEPEEANNSDLSGLKMRKVAAEINLLKAQTNKIELERKVMLLNKYTTLSREEKWSNQRIARAFPEMSIFFP